MDFEVLEANPRPPFPHLIPVRVFMHIRKNATGEVMRRETTEFVQPGETYPSTYNWEEGNFACDCNRALFFDGEQSECSRDRFSVNLENPQTGEIYYLEFST